MLEHITTVLAKIVLGKLFLPAPAMNVTPQQARAFDAQYESLVAGASGDGDAYDCPYPKHEFLRYIVREKDVLLHGSNRLDIRMLVPQEQSDWNGKRMKAVFASGDGIWPLFFAAVDHANYRGSLRNGCFVVGREKASEYRYYFFSLNAAYRRQNVWRQGMVYVVPKAGFRRTCDGPVRFDEWASESAVKPIARIAVTPDDFPFLHKVAWHYESEPMLVSWLMFKRRVGTSEETIRRST